MDLHLSSPLRRPRAAASVAVLALAAAAVSPASALSADLLSSRDAASFARMARSISGPVGVAVSPLGRDRPVETLGSLRSAVAWSTSKVPVAMAVVAAGRGRAQRQDLVQAITASDNAAAERLWRSLGSGRAAARAADAQLRAAGDRRTRMESRRLRAGFTPFGQTTWTLTDQARFTAGMSCTSAGRQVLDLMGQVVAGQRWGLGAAGGAAQIKGGWGPGVLPGVNSGYLDRQMGVVTVQGRPLAVTLASLPGDGSHETGLRNLTRLARWVVSHVDARRIGAQPRC